MKENTGTCPDLDTVVVSIEFHYCVPHHFFFFFGGGGGKRDLKCFVSLPVCPIVFFCICLSLLTIMYKSHVRGLNVKIIARSSLFLDLGGLCSCSVCNVFFLLVKSCKTEIAEPSTTIKMINHAQEYVGHNSRSLQGQKSL